MPRGTDTDGIREWLEGQGWKKSWTGLWRCGPCHQLHLAGGEREQALKLRRMNKKTAKERGAG